MRLDTMTDKHIRIALIVCSAAIVCAWIMRPSNRYRLDADCEYLLDTASGRVWCMKYDRGADEMFFIELERRKAEVQEPQQSKTSTPLRFNPFPMSDFTEETPRNQR